MRTVDIREATIHLSCLIDEVGAGQEIVLTRAGKPVARLVPFHRTRKRRLGILAGRISVPEDVDAPLPQDVLESFERGS